MKGSHADNLVEMASSLYYDFCKKSFRYIVIDDFVVSGNTVHRICSEMKKDFPQGELAGVYPYQQTNGNRLLEKSITFRIFNPSGGRFKPE